MSRSALALALACGLVGAHAASAEAPLETDDQKTLYTIGLRLAKNLGALYLSEDELAVVQAGIEDGVLGRAARVDAGQYGPGVNAFVDRRLGAVAASEQGRAEAFLAKAAEGDGAEKTESGLILVETQAGSGEQPAAESTVTVHYRGTLRDGSVFDSSYDRGSPATFQLDRVIPCWTEALQRMLPGGKATIYCPAALAYGDKGTPDGSIRPGAALRFEVELLEIAR